MAFDLDEWIGSTPFAGLSSMEDIIEEAAWSCIERNGWVPTPELLFALKETIREQMLGG